MSEAPGRARRAPWVWGVVLCVLHAGGAGLVLSGAGLGDAGRGRAGVVALVAAAAAHTVGAVRGLSGRWLVSSAAIAGAIWLSGAPALSDDVYRYLLDGAMGRAGLSPFAYPPASPKVADLVAALPGPPNHRHLTTIYPPVAQALFALFGHSTRSWRVFLVVALTAGGWVGDRLPRRLGRVGAGTFVAAHPLLVLTACSNGNVDAIAPLLIFLALIALERGPRRAALIAGLAGGVKLFPVALPVVWGGAQGLRRAAGPLAVAVAVLAATYVPGAGAGAKSLGSLGTFASTWAFNGSFHSAFEALFSWAARSAWGQAVRVPGDGIRAAIGSVGSVDGAITSAQWLSPAQVGGMAARAVAALALVLVVVREARYTSDAARASAAFVFVLLLLSPVVHPWYLCWLLPFGTVAGLRAPTVWGSSVLVAYWAPASTFDGGPWLDRPWVRALEYAPVLAAATWGGRAQFRPRDGSVRPSDA